MVICISRYLYAVKMLTKWAKVGLFSTAHSVPPRALLPTAANLCTGFAAPAPVSLHYLSNANETLTIKTQT